MKKRIFSMIITVMLSLSVIAPVYTVEGAEMSKNHGENEAVSQLMSVDRILPLIVDNADLLTADEESKLTTKLETIGNEHNAEVAIVTVTDLEGKTAQAYADDFYDYNGYGYGEGKDGVLVLYKPGEDGDRKLHITTHGTAIKEFSDSTIDDILYEMKDYLVAEDYYTAFDVYADRCADALKPPSVSLFWIPVCLVAGFLIALLISKGIESSLRPVKKQKNAANYVRQGSMMVTGAQDVFMYRNVSRTEIQRSDDSGSDSSTHTSSSGETHGGGGISF